MDMISCKDGLDHSCKDGHNFKDGCFVGKMDILNYQDEYGHNHNFVDV